MSALIGVTTVWSMETWGEMADHPGGILYNPVQYSNALYQSGGLLCLIAPPTEIRDNLALQKIVEHTLDHVSALFFSGGGGNRRFKAPDMPGLEKQQPLRYNFEKMLIQEAWKRQMPVLAACRGHQMIVEALGGNIKEETVTGHQQKEEEKTAHSVRITEDSRLASLVKTASWEVNSMHCQVAETAPPQFIVTARSPEGYIEAIEATGPVFWMSFQFHPEAMYTFDSTARSVLKAFVGAAEDHAGNS